MFANNLQLLLLQLPHFQVNAVRSAQAIAWC